MDFEPPSQDIVQQGSLIHHVTRTCGPHYIPACFDWMAEKVLRVDKYQSHQPVQDALVKLRESVNSTRASTRSARSPPPTDEARKGAIREFREQHGIRDEKMEAFRVVHYCLAKIETRLVFRLEYISALLVDLCAGKFIEKDIAAHYGHLLVYVVHENKDYRQGVAVEGRGGVEIAASTMGQGIVSAWIGIGVSDSLAFGVHVVCI
ncbi:hypothetical protein BDV95DRAFT_585757 [Massariosphaeria phaeospora]|uniref:Uncharacterized protein n=1 Tax=Massariosphaeria phaeospora TaxID=100035 RepID=A0A7C8I0G0_9PLEO|nr:hypothetical protein BDV95DRAFT_585757 [Massariosphaeria phaeospora]